MAQSPLAPMLEHYACLLAGTHHPRCIPSWRLKNAGVAGGQLFGLRLSLCYGNGIAHMLKSICNHSHNEWGNILLGQV
eukprot:1152670-Pelagomonas_calceolata.AAC.3